MTATDSRPRHARPLGVSGSERTAGARHMSVRATRPVATHGRHAAAPSEIAGYAASLYSEPPAGLGPWVPPLPVPEPQLTPRVWAWLGSAVVLLLTGVAAAVSLVVAPAAQHGTVANPDQVYVSTVRAGSGLSGVEASDSVLVDTGQSVCAALDDLPTRVGVLAVLRAVGETFGWSDAEAAAVVVSAISTYCPRHATLVQD